MRIVLGLVFCLQLLAAPSLTIEQLLSAPFPVCAVVFLGSIGAGPWIWAVLTPFALIIAVARRKAGPAYPRPAPG